MNSYDINDLTNMLSDLNDKKTNLKEAWEHGMLKYELKNFILRTHGHRMEQHPTWGAISALPFTLDMEKGPWLAGGAVRRLIQGTTTESDYDIFVSSSEQADHINEMFVTNEKVYHFAENEFSKFYNLNTDDGVKKINVISNLFYPCAHDVIDSFDFTICQFITDGIVLGVGDHSLWDLARNRLAIHRVTYGVSTVRRLIKYEKQGFHACSGTIANILREVSRNPELINADVLSLD